jgi:ribose-phosphate pyrophosphokinase
MELKILSGTSHPELARDIARHLNVPLTKTTIKTFKNGEIYARIEESIRGDDVFVIQSPSHQVNDALMELLILIDALKRASAGRITAVMPHYCYARQDFKSKPREPITAKLVADLLTAAGVSRILTVDLHADQIPGFFNIPVDNLWAENLFFEYFKQKNTKDVVVVAADAGGAKRARHLAKKFQTDIAIIDKRKEEHYTQKAMNVVGDVKGKNCILLDDMIDTGGTIISGAEALKGQGAKTVSICATHAVFSGNAKERLLKSVAEEIVVTDAIPTKSEKKLKVLSVAKLLAEAISSIHQNKSVSELSK